MYEAIKKCNEYESDKKMIEISQALEDLSRLYVGVVLPYSLTRVRGNRPPPLPAVMMYIFHFNFLCHSGLHYVDRVQAQINSGNI